MATVPDRNAADARPGTIPQEPAIAPELRIVEWQNEWIVRSAYPFVYQAPNAMLADLGDRYRLDEVIAPGASEFEQMLLLREWVHTRWKHGWSRTPPAQNALEILRAAEQGSDFNCGYFALTLMQCLLALGFVARIAGVSKTATEWKAEDEGNTGHSVTEVWSHEYHKWVLLDSDLNVHYEQGGVPLNVLEVHRAWVTRRWQAVRQVQGPTPYRMSEKRRSGYLVVRKNHNHHLAERWTFDQHQVGDYYAHLGLVMHNTQHSGGGAAPNVDWIDEWTAPRVIQSNMPSAARWTSNEGDLYWTVDQVQIDLRAETKSWQSQRALLQVTLAHSMPNLSKLLVRLDDEPWRETPASFVWPLKPGKNQIMARPVNAFGREGHVDRVLLRYLP